MLRQHSNPLSKPLREMLPDVYIVSEILQANRYASMEIRQKKMFIKPTPFSENEYNKKKAPERLNIWIYYKFMYHKPQQLFKLKYRI